MAEYRVSFGPQPGSATALEGVVLCLTDFISSRTNESECASLPQELHMAMPEKPAIRTANHNPLCVEFAVFTRTYRTMVLGFIERDCAALIAHWIFVPCRYT